MIVPVLATRLTRFVVKVEHLQIKPLFICVCKASRILACGTTHFPLDKMAAILAADIFKHIFFNENIRISIQISLKFVPEGLIDNMSALVQVMAWRWKGDKPLPEAMMTQFTNAYMRY